MSLSVEPRVSGASSSKILDVLNGGVHSVPPLWMMRQAGRYLPEYRAVRQKAGSFLDLCYSPNLATEVTLQPIERFGFDAAILFSDILVIPDAMGRSVRFEESRGPVLEPIDAAAISGLRSETVLDHLAPVIETVTSVRARLDPGKALLGFCGAPWTVATYMIAGHGTTDQAPARTMAMREPDAFQALIDRLVEASIEYLIAQLDAGADAVQIFDTWAGVLDELLFDRFVVSPTQAIVSGVRSAVPNAKIIGFPKNAGSALPGYVQKTGIDAVGLDWSVPMETARRLQGAVAVQGNLDPMRLKLGGRALDEGIDHILEHLVEGPFIFNLGHGITPDVPISHVERLVARVRGQV